LRLTAAAAAAAADAAASAAAEACSACSACSSARNVLCLRSRRDRRPAPSPLAPPLPAPSPSPSFASLLEAAAAAAVASFFDALCLNVRQLRAPLLLCVCTTTRRLRGEVLSLSLSSSLARFVFCCSLPRLRGLLRVNFAGDDCEDVGDERVDRGVGDDDIALGVN
jgi:hypothetical protein